MVGSMILAKYSGLRLKTNWVTEINSVRISERHIYINETNANKSRYLCRRQQCQVYMNLLDNF